MSKDFDWRIFYPADPPWEHFLFHQHYNLLCDPRVPAWKEAIEKSVQPGDLVLEIGSGSGLLSMFCAQKARQVYAVETDPKMVEYSNWAIKKAGLSDKIQVFGQNARKALKLPEKVDLIIAEMLDTALIQEPQAPVLKKVIPKWLKKKGRVMPLRVQSSAELCWCDYSFYGFDLPLPHFETTEVRKTRKTLSPKIIYHRINFPEDYPLEVSRELEFTASAKGFANSLKIETRVELIPGLWAESSHWFNPPLILPFPEIALKENERFKVQLAYQLGGGLKTLRYWGEKL